MSRLRQPTEAHRFQTRNAELEARNPASSPPLVPATGRPLTPEEIDDALDAD